MSGNSNGTRRPAHGRNDRAEERRCYVLRALDRPRTQAELRDALGMKWDPESSSANGARWFGAPCRTNLLHQNLGARAQVDDCSTILPEVRQLCSDCGHLDATQHPAVWAPCRR